QELISDRECGDVRPAFLQRELADAAYRHLQGAADHCGSELAQARLALVRNDADPVVRFGEHLLDLVDGQVAPQLHGERLAVAAHRSNAHADSIDRHGTIFSPQDLVAFGLPLPFFAALPVAEVLVDPGKQAAGERGPELRARKRVVAQRRSYRTV